MVLYLTFYTIILSTLDALNTIVLLISAPGAYILFLKGYLQELCSSSVLMGDNKTFVYPKYIPILYPLHYNCQE